ncbi:hypothetical protein QH494_07905 [Sphingomonas sp. AR_OL41]|uniref:hypothetical protein n=1 Tax=Sphingomonas sp. AR_OL41 TaxID=3042729 RepID=UPI0024816181|nr:hypothetical protein [Sphingomonas sp. AR_OL41]MDH7972107.1 hypothetical protein [Sphingomonas sp. AR_OL41]
MTATTVTAVFSGLAYVMPIIVGFVADRWLGRTRTVAAGALLMTIGHLFMSFYATFLVALVFSTVGGQRILQQ